MVRKTKKQKEAELAIEKMLEEEVPEEEVPEEEVPEADEELYFTEEDLKKLLNVEEEGGEQEEMESMMADYVLRKVSGRSRFKVYMRKNLRGKPSYP